MNKLRTFANTLIKTHTEPAYFRDVLSARFSFSFKYFLLYYLLMALASTLLFNFTIKPQLKSAATDSIHELTTNYPNDLVISLESGQTKLQGQEPPLHVPFPQSFGNNFLTKDYDHLLTIDPTSQVAEKNSLFTLASDSLIVRQVDGTKQSVPLSDVEENITIDRNTIQLFTSSISSRIDSFFAYLPILFFIGFYLVSVFLALLSLLIYSLFTYIIANVLQKRISYKKSYQLGLHLITFAETVSFLQHLLTPQFSFSGLFSLAFFGAAALAVHSLPSHLKPKTK